MLFSSETRSLPESALAISGMLVDQQAPLSTPKEGPVAPVVRAGVGVANSSPHPCLAGNLPAEPSTQPKSFDLLF